MKKMEQLQLYALALPVGKLIPGFLTPIFSRATAFYVQCVTQDGGVSDVAELKLGGGHDGPLLQVSALEQDAGPKLVKLSQTGPRKSKAPVVAFFDGNVLLVGYGEIVSAYLKGALPRLMSSLRERPFAIASVLDFVGEPTLAARVRNARSVNVPEIPDQSASDDSPMVVGQFTQQPDRRVRRPRINFDEVNAYSSAMRNKRQHYRIQPYTNAAGLPGHSPQRSGATRDRARAT